MGPIPVLRRTVPAVLVGLLGLAAATAGAAGFPVPLAPPNSGGPWARDAGTRLHRLHEAETKARLGAKRAAAAVAASPNMALYDVQFYDLALELEPALTRLTGTVTTVATVTGASLAVMELDLDPNMIVSAARSGGAPTTFARSGPLLKVDLDRTYTAGEKVTVAVDYFGNPTSDYFGFEVYGGEPLIWSLSEPYGARRWWPCKDLNTDKADSVALHVTVPDNLIVASNGTLDAETVPGPGRRTFHWTERHPIATYLVSVTAHPYVVLEDRYVSAGGDTMPIVHYAVPDRAADAATGYAITPTMLGVFADLYGEYPYLDEKYGHAHFLWGGGMEHQTCSSMTANYHGDTFIAHEMAHQWMGDLVTCADFSHIWINEGFATWSEAYWREQNEGVAAYRAEMNDARYLGPGTIYVEDPSNFYAIFDYNLSYQKASWVPHMLRRVVGEEAFRAGLQVLRDAHGYATATTADVQGAFEGVSGLDLGPFFQQWIYGEYYPRYLVDWDVVPEGGQSRVLMKITQVPVADAYFTMPLDVRIFTSLGDTTLVVQNSAPEEWYALVVDGTVSDVAVDPDGWVLCEVVYGGASGVPAAEAVPAVALTGNAPNPFNPATEIRFRLAAPGRVSLDVHDAAGRLVSRIFAGELAAGEHRRTWRGTDRAGRDVASGTYFVRLRGAAGADVLPITLLR